jgi:hypothetical protein
LCPLKGDGRFTASGSGYNKFGKFLFNGSVWGSAQGGAVGGEAHADAISSHADGSFNIELFKSYTGEPAPEPPAKATAAKGAAGGGRPKSEKKKPQQQKQALEVSSGSSSSSSSLKRPRGAEAVAQKEPRSAAPTAAAAAPPVPPVSSSLSSSSLASSSSTTAAAATPVAAADAEIPCMRGTLTTGSTGGVVGIKGQWAIKAADFNPPPTPAPAGLAKPPLKLTSPFEYTLDPGGSLPNTASSSGGGGHPPPTSGVYSGGFSMKFGGRTKRVKEGGIPMTFLPSSSSTTAGGVGVVGEYSVSAKGTNEFGTFTMHGSAKLNDPSSSGGGGGGGGGGTGVETTYSVEIFRTYTSFAPAPANKPSSGRGWAVVEAGSVAPASASLSRMQSEPAQKEPRSGGHHTSAASSSSSISSIPRKAGVAAAAAVAALAVPEPLSPDQRSASSLSSSSSGADGRRRKAPQKLANDLQVVGSQRKGGGGGGTSAAGLEGAVRSKLEALVRQLKGLKDAVYFLDPVDPVALGIPAYFEVVKEPMDFGTVEKRLGAGVGFYRDPEQVLYDLRLVLSNSRLFNGLDPLGPVMKSTKKLEEVLEGKWREFEGWLANREATAATSAWGSKSAAKSASGKSKAPKRQGTGGGGGGGGGAAAAAVSYDPVGPDAGYGLAAGSGMAVMTQMAELQKQIFELQAQNNTQQLQLHLAAATAALPQNPQGQRSLSVRDVLDDNPMSDAILNNFPLTLEEKTEVTQQIDTLPDDKLNRVIEIIEEQMQLSGLEDKEIEVDVDTLPIPTLRALQKYLKECYPKPKLQVQPQQQQQGGGCGGGGRGGRGGRGGGGGRGRGGRGGGGSETKKRKTPLPVPQHTLPAYDAPKAKRSRASNGKKGRGGGGGASAAASGYDTSDSDDDDGAPAMATFQPGAQSLPPAASPAPPTFVAPPVPAAAASLSPPAAPSAAPSAAAVAEAGRRIAGLDSDSDSDDDDDIATAVAGTSAAPAFAPPPPRVAVAADDAGATAAAPTVNVSAWTTSVQATAALPLGANGDGAALARQRSDSFTDDAAADNSTWSQFQSGIQEKEQLEAFRLEEERARQAKFEQQQENALVQSQKLAEARKAQTAAAAAAAVEAEAAEERALGEAREKARLEREGQGQTVNLDAVGARDEVDSFMKEYC